MMESKLNDNHLKELLNAADESAPQIQLKEISVADVQSRHSAKMFRRGVMAFVSIILAITILQIRWDSASNELHVDIENPQQTDLLLKMKDLNRSLDRLQKKIDDQLSSSKFLQDRLTRVDKLGFLASESAAITGVVYAQTLQMEFDDSDAAAREFQSVVRHFPASKSAKRASDSLMALGMTKE